MNLRHVFMNTTKYTITAFFCLFLMSFMVLGQNFPVKPKALVSDYTHTLSAGQVATLEDKLRLFEDSTSTQVAVVIVNSTDGYDVKDYAVRLAEQWGVGQKNYNNGVVLLVALEDRAVTIQTGYGVEGALPDVLAYRIIENEIKPAFRKSDYFEGINNATDAIISAIKGEYSADPKDNRRGERGSGNLGGVIVVVIVFVIVAIISKGGGKNGGGRVINGRGGSDLFWWMLLNGMGRGGSDGGRSSRGGFGGGGGFGGFGGGSFGGGGASGRW